MTQRLLLVIPTYIGFKVFLRELAVRLRDEGWEIELACSTSNYPAQVEAEEGVRRHEVDFPRGANPWHYLRAARQLRRVVRDKRPTLIHAHFSSAICATALARQRSWPITLGTFQGLIHPLQRGMRRVLYRRVERWSASRMDGTWVLSADDLAALRGIPNTHLQRTTGFGADHLRFRRDRFSEDDRAAQRRAWGVPADGVVFVYVGRFVAFKGFAETARAAMRVVRQESRAYFVFVGTPDPLHASGLNPQEMERLHRSPRVTCVGWTDDVPRVLRASDCFVFPSAREGMSVSIMEALTMGLPVITTSARGCRELVTDGVTGWIVEQTDSAVEAAVRNVLAFEGRLSEFAARAQASSAAMSRERYVDEQIAIYRAVL